MLRTTRIFRRPLPRELMADTEAAAQERLELGLKANLNLYSDYMGYPIIFTALRYVKMFLR